MATVRYVSSSDGLNVRSTPGGTIITTLFYGNLMYEIPCDGPETQDGWTKVHYYLNGPIVSEGEGWVATAYTTVISKNSVPGKSATFNDDSVLIQYHRLINAWYIYNYLIKLGWSANALYAMLANIEAESYLNPGKWEAVHKKGYGLTQWTPSTKLTDWAAENGYDAGDIDTQIKRIEYERCNGLQWMSSEHNPEMTFVEFSQSTKPVATLAEYFVRCYEIPDVFIDGTEAQQSATILERQRNATKWRSLLINLV